MRKFLSIIFFLLTIFGLFAEDCEWDFDFFDDLDLAVLETIFKTKIDEKSRKIELSVGLGAGVSPIVNGGYGQGKGKGRTNEVKNQSGIYANEIDMKSGSLSLKGAYIIAKRGRISTRELLYQNLEDKHDYRSHSWYINSNPFTMLANQVGKELAESMTPRNTTAGSAIIGSMAFDHRSETRRGTTFATVAEGIDIETDSDISGLNRDASRLKETRIDEKSHMSLMIPIVDFDKLKSNIKEIGQTYDSLKSKMADRFKGWKTAANGIESQSNREEMTKSIAKLESDYQKTMEKLAKSEVGDDEKMDQAKKIELALMDAIEGGGIKVPGNLNNPEFNEFRDVKFEGDDKTYSPYEIAQAGGIDALREQIANAQMIKTEQAMKNSFLIRNGNGEKVTRLMFAVDSVQNHEFFMEKLGRYLGATGDYAVRFTSSGARTFVEITFGTLKESFEGYTLMVNLADEMLKGSFQKDLNLMANLEDGQFKSLMTDYGIEVAINTWKELKELGPNMLEALKTPEGQGSIVAVACTMKPWKAGKVLKPGGKKKSKGKDNDNDNNKDKSKDQNNEPKRDQESSPERVMTQEEMLAQLKPHVREQIKGMEIPEPKVRGGGMLAHEARGGHGLEKHMEKTIEELADRFKTNTDLAQSSTFTKWKRAEDLIEETMQKKQHEIDFWIKNGKKGKVRLQQPFDEITGITLDKGSNIPRNANEVVVILKEDKTSKLGYFILTAFPYIK